MQHSASVRRGRAKEVPFGIRALERGVEVEGIWNSAANTPVPSLPGSPRLSVATVKGRLPHDLSTGRPSTATSAGSVSTPDEICHVADQGSSSLDTETQTRGRSPYRPRHQPRRGSGLRFNNSHDDPDHPEILATLEGRPLGEASRNKQRSASVSGSSSNEDEHHERLRTSYASNYLHPEDGLIHPTYHDYISSGNSSQTSQDSNPFLTPTVSRQSTEEPWPLSHPDGLVPLDGANEPAVYHTQLLTDAEITYDEGHAQPFRPLDTSRPERKSQVIRKVNSGFEILEPGSLEMPRQSIDVHSLRTDDGSKEKRMRKKLQKKAQRQSGGIASLKAGAR